MIWQDNTSLYLSHLLARMDDFKPQNTTEIISNEFSAVSTKL